MVHLATHGFFIPAQHALAQDARISPPPRGAGYLSHEQHPLLRSGLLLANANKVWGGGTVTAGAADGILSALEVSRLSLQPTELVVLSACETALGDVRTGEGVYGLQRAFLAAGASSLMMSLWKVPDRLTAEFMTTFYRGWLGGMSKAEAIRAARAAMRSGHPDPRIWAAFILVGE